MIHVENMSTSFTLHPQGGAVIPVMAGAHLQVDPGECVGLVGQSGSGKSTLMRMIHGNSLPGGGSIRIAGLQMAGAEPRRIIARGRDTLGYVRRVLRVLPRLPAVQVMAEPLRALGMPKARARAEALLARLNIPRRLWSLSPTPFSGGEQQRGNIARGVVHPFPVLLLDEPTASLNARKREVVLALIAEAEARDAAILGILHDEEARARVCDRLVDVTGFTSGRPA